MLSGIDWRDFEFLVAALYEAKGYDVEVTPEQKDGGRDAIARRTGADAETLYVACSRGSRKKDADSIAALNGRLDTGTCVVGVWSGFHGARAGVRSGDSQGNAAVSLLGGDGLISQLNQYLGTDWFHRVDRIVVEHVASTEHRPVR